MDAPPQLPTRRSGQLRHNGPPTGRNAQHCAARLLCRGNELLHASHAFSTWAAATRERKLRVHMSRCSTMMKRSALRHGYSRFFLRWLAFTHSRTSKNYRLAAQQQRDVPLRSKADFLALARRYFTKWRTHLREKKQRMVTNVDLLAALNRERLRNRSLLRWWRFYHTSTTKRHSLEINEHENSIRRLQAEVQEAVNEAQALRNQLTEALQTQTRLQQAPNTSREDFGEPQQQLKAEINELREAMRTAIEMVKCDDGLNLRSLRKWGVMSPTRKDYLLASTIDMNSTLGRQSTTPEILLASPLVDASGDCPMGSAQHSKDMQLMLVRSIEKVIENLADLGRSSVAPMSLGECIESIRRRLEDDAKELANVKTQRDELAAAARAVRLAFASTLPPLGTVTSSAADPELEVCQATPASSLGLLSGGGKAEVSGRPATPAGCSVHRADRSSSRAHGAAEAIINSSLFVAHPPSGTSTPCLSLPSSPLELSHMDLQELPQLLIADTRSVVSAVAALQKCMEQAKNEVTDLQDAALRTIDALGGRGVVNDGFIAPPDETVESRVQRSEAIVKGLRNLCEDMIVALVLTSLWSGNRASERVSDTLERLWNRTQDLEATNAAYLKQLTDLEKVVHVAARQLRRSNPAPATKSPRNTARRRVQAATSQRRRNAAIQEEEGPPTADEVDEARRCAEELGENGDTKAAELLRLCEEALSNAASQSAVLTSVLDGLLQGSQELLAATVGVENDGASQPAADLPVSDQNQGTHSAMSVSRPKAQEMVTALKAATEKVACVLNKVGGGASKPLILVTQDVLDHLEQAEETRVEVEKQLKATEEQVAAMESNALSTEKAHRREREDLVKVQREVERELQSQLEALEQEAKQEAEKHQRAEREVNALQNEKMEVEAALQKSQEALERETAAREQALKKYEEQCETAGADRMLHTKEMEMLNEAQRTLVEQNQKMAASIEAIREELQSTEAQLISSSEKEQELQARLIDSAKQLAESHAAQCELRDQLTAAKAAGEAEAAVRADQEQQLLFFEGENRMNNAVGIFLRDVLRDCLTRLHHLTRSVGVAETQSPRSSLMLQHAGGTPPPLLTHDSDPSEYVEYILRLDGNDSIGKRLVQEHLRENFAVHSVKEPVVAAAGEEDATSTANTAAAAAMTFSPSGDRTDPSTWEVVAELHDRLVLLYERMAYLDDVAAEQLAVNNALTREKDQFCTDALVALRQLQPWSSAAAAVAAAAAHQASGLSRSTSPVSPVDHFQEVEQVNAALVSAVGPEVAGPALRTSSLEITQTLEELQKVMDVVRPLVPMRSHESDTQSAIVTAVPNGAVTVSKYLQALVADVQDMAWCLQNLSKSAQNGILALGGSAAGDEEDESELDATGTGSPNVGVDHGATSGSEDFKLDSRILAARLEAICRETGTSIIEVRNLVLSSGGKSAADSDASQGSVKPFKLSCILSPIHNTMAEFEEVKRESARLLHGLSRAFDDDEESLFAGSISSLQSRSLKPKKKPLPAFQGTPEAGLRLLQQEIKGKKHRRAGGAKSKVSIGSHIRSRLGDLQNLHLACRSVLQVLEGRVPAEEGEQPPAYGEALVALLKTELEGLKQSVTKSDEVLKDYRRDLSNVSVGTRLHLLSEMVNSLQLERTSLTEDINRRGRQSNMLLESLNKEVKALKAQLASRQQANAQLTGENDRLSEELVAQKLNATELAARLAQLQHESNVLSTALAQSLHGFSASMLCGKTPIAVERSIQAALKSDQGDALAKSVSEVVSAAEQHQLQLRDMLHRDLGNLRAGLQELRELTSQSWALYGAPMAAAAAQLVTETAEVLTLENDMLRPRALEREKLKREVASLEAALADSQEMRDAAIERLGHLEDDNTKLRRGLRDAEMAQVLNATEKDSAAGQTSLALDQRMVDWERRMITSATDLAMDAMDSMSGQSMSAVVGSVTEETLRIYKGVRESLRVVAQACEASAWTDARRFWAEVEQCRRDIDELSASADYLWSHLPILYRASYQ
ncbi:hypothetical protein ABL78_4656 [Leptomonas seymouri]|uniref:Uncharacterized protein n=1 Tax=Leptomonas seymouri TaxID=5684 RepID=A0A0N1I4L3_LEPSE|nr:hypothetical protein ABL78_4656 [Leptomonas seymouri]|eukprot:KPI86273.1 hypothetical protein ABL78_4656 [Leptomonas seymouri]